MNSSVSSVELLMVKLLLNIESTQTPVLKLYTNDHTPHLTDTVADYKEAQGYGYKSMVLLPTNWSFPPEDILRAVYPEVSYLFKGHLGNIYGYYITQQQSNTLLWAVRFFDGPYTIMNHGDKINLTVSLTLHGSSPEEHERSE